MTDIIIPDDLWDDDTTGVIVTWMYDDGDVVDKDAAVAQIMVEKVQFDITAPAEGVLRIGREAEAEINRGDKIGEIADG